MKIKLVEEFMGTFGTKYLLEIESNACTSVVEISEFQFERLKREQCFRNFPTTVNKPLPSKVEILKDRKEWAIL